MLLLLCCHQARSLMAIPRSWCDARAVEIAGVASARSACSSLDQSPVKSTSSSRCGPICVCCVDTHTSGSSPSLLHQGRGKMACWGCAEKCGACCYLKPAERELLDEWLPDAADRALYESMVGDDGWCVHYDKVERLCTVYDDRPQFCRVDADKWQETLGLHEAELARTAREACKDWIGSVYGAKSDEMLRYQQKMALLVRSERERRRSAARLKGESAS